MCVCSKSPPTDGQTHATGTSHRHTRRVVTRMSRRRHRTMSFSYPHSEIERQIDSFLETFKRRSAAAMERAQSLQGGPGGLLSPYINDSPTPESSPASKIRSPRRCPRVKFHIPGRRSRWAWSGRPASAAGVPRSKSGVSVASSETDSGSDSMEGLTRSLPHSLHTWASADSIPGEYSPFPAPVNKASHYHYHSAGVT